MKELGWFSALDRVSNPAPRCSVSSKKPSTFSGIGSPSVPFTSTEKRAIAKANIESTGILRSGRLSFLTAALNLPMLSKSIALIRSVESLIVKSSFVVIGVFSLNHSYLSNAPFVVILNVVSLNTRIFNESPSERSPEPPSLVSLNSLNVSLVFCGLYVRPISSLSGSRSWKSSRFSLTSIVSIERSFAKLSRPVKVLSASFRSFSIVRSLVSGKLFSSVFDERSIATTLSSSSTIESQSCFLTARSQFTLALVAVLISSSASKSATVSGRISVLTAIVSLVVGGSSPLSNVTR